MNSLYDVLELSQNASTDAIDASYQRLKSLYEKNMRDQIGDLVDNENRLKAVNYAHSLLRDPQKRSRYDEELAARHRPTTETGTGSESAGSASPFGEKSKAALLIAVPVVAVLYIALNFLVDFGSVEVQEQLADSATAARAEELTNDRLALDHQNERDVRDHERLTSELATIRAFEAQRLETEAERLRFQAELLQEQLALRQLHQQRQALALQYQTNARSRMLNMEERKLEIAERETDANRAYIDDVRNDAKISRNVARIEKAIELQRDINAEKHGLSRRQYDAILDARR